MVNRVSLRLSSSLLLAIFAAVVATPAEAGTVTPGWRKLQIPATGSYAQRYLPPGLDPDVPAPVIVFLHGSGSSPEGWQPILAPLADDLGAVFLVPKSLEALGFGPGDDQMTIDEALSFLRAEVTVDEERISISGHSAGGAYAAVLAYQAVSRFSGVFILSSPYRIVLSVADPAYTAPIRMYYGRDDPNFQGGSYQAMRAQWNRLGIPQEEEIRGSFGHNDWPETTLPDGFRFLLAQHYATGDGCVPSDRRLCLQGGRFAVEGSWRNFQGAIGTAHAVPLGSDDSGMLWFFRDANWEMLVKVLNGCANNGHYWVLASASTTVEYELRVTDLRTGQVETYTNPLGNASPAITDVRSFATCP